MSSVISWIQIVYCTKFFDFQKKDTNLVYITFLNTSDMIFSKETGL